jgi:hypothetical protein
MADISLEGLTPEAIQGLALTAKSMLENPATRRETLALVKRVDPSQNIPEIDLPAQFTTMLDEERAARKKIEDEMRDDRIRREVNDRRETIMSKGIAREDVEKVEKLMTERGIVNHETAAEFYQAQQHMATPTPPAHLAYQPLELPKFDLTKGNIRTQGKTIAADMLAGFRSGKIAA